MVVGDEDDSQRECVSAAPVPASRDCQEVLLWSIPTARCYIRLVSIVPSLMGRIIPSAGTIPSIFTSSLKTNPLVTISSFIERVISNDHEIDSFNWTILTSTRSPDPNPDEITNNTYQACSDYHITISCSS